MELMGYVDPLAAKTGEAIACHVSVAREGEVDIDVVRLIHGDESPVGPGFKVEAVEAIPACTIAASPQRTHCGSCMVIEGLWEDAPAKLAIELYVWPTLPARGRRQGLISITGSDGTVLALALGADGRLELVTGVPERRTTQCRIDAPLSARSWFHVSVTLDAVAELATIALGHGERHTSTCACPPIPVHANCVIGALSCERPQGQPMPVDCFNGKLEHPRVFDGATLLAEWRFELEVDGAEVVDASGRNKHGRLINLPARAMTGHSWTGDELSHSHAPEQYAAAHFHEDDLEDARWEESVRLNLPDDLRSGVYAVRLRHRDDVDHVPFCVVPHGPAARAPVTLLVPTFTYLAYANERLLEREPHSISVGRHDAAVASHPEFGLSLYDRHIDGSGVCYATSRRPLLNIRPDYRSWVHGAPRHLSADLYIVDWLEHAGVPYDVVTDHDLHRDGVAALGDSRVVITGGHPEYVTGKMLDGLEAFLARGGRMMYLGGNGFYWVTSQDPERDHVIEVRRGVSGTRTWESEPGEVHHSTTGEPGGLWRHRGRPPNALTGVGFSGQLTGVRSANVQAMLKAPGYRRAPDSFRPETAFAFEGIGESELIGDFGLIMSGASGDEIDRYDVSRGSPPDALVIATSTGHSEHYLLCCEDVLMTSSTLAGTNNDLVRSDMVLLRLTDGGAVFSVGSICFAGSLSHNGYANNVARLATNVLREFMRP